MNKTIEFKARFDTSDFDKSIQDIQKKLKDVFNPTEMMRSQMQTSQRLQGMGMGGIMSAPSMEAYKRSTQQARREMDQSIREQAQGQEKLSKLIAQREEKLVKLRDMQREITKGSKEELEIKEKISRVEENNFRLRESYRQRDAALNQVMDARQNASPQGLERLSQAFAGGGIGGAGRAAFRMAGGMGGIASMGVGALGGLIPMLPNLYRDYSRAPLQTGMALGSATQGTVGRELESIYGGRSPFEMAFMPEKARAALMARDVTGASRRADIGQIFAPTIGGALAGGAAGAALGGVGAIPGALAGGAIGLGKTGYDFATNERMRALILSPISETYAKKYAALNAQEFAENFGKALESEKQQNPLKKLAAEEYQQNFTRNLQLQRSLGLDFGGFHGAGGFRDRAIGAGFTDEMGMDRANQILGAGGSTRMARQSVTALQAERGFGLTNASQVLGTISGGVGSAESSRQALVKTLAEGTRLGLNQSDFAEENRRFVQSTAEIISRSGARTDSDIDRVISNFGKFVNDPTNKGVEAARTAYEQYQQISTSSTGPQGVMRAAGFLKSASLGGMSGIDKAALSNIPAEQLTEDHPIVRDLAQRYKLSPTAIVEERTKIDQGAINRLPGADALVKRIRGETGAARTNDIGQLTTMTAAQFPGLGQDRRALESFVGGEVAGKPADMGALLKKTQAQLTTTATGRVEDETVRGMAESSKLMLDNFRQFRDQITPTAEAMGKFNSQLKQTVDIIMRMPEGERSGLFSKMFPALFQDHKSQTQTQGGR